MIRALRRRPWIVLSLAIAIRLALAPGKGFPTDIDAFESWAAALARFGPHALFADGSGTRWPVVDYPPAYLLVLGLLGLLHASVCHCTATGGLGFKILIKLPAMLADFGLAWLVSRIVLRRGNPDQAYAVFAGVLLLPPLWLVSAYWGQVDSVAACAVAAAVLTALERRSLAAWLLLGLAILIKPQSLPLVLPFLLWETCRPGALRRLAAATAACLALAYAVSLPFAPVAEPTAVFRWLVERYANGVGKYPNNSSGAFNVYTIFDRFYLSDARLVAGLPLRVWGLALVGGLMLTVALVLQRRLAAARDDAERERAFLAANFISLAGLFTLATRMHERYLLPGLALGATVAPLARAYALAEAGLGVVFTFNCAFILLGFYGGSHHPLALAAAHAGSLLGVLSFAVALCTFLAGERKKTRAATTRIARGVTLA